jgi:hypothetical protein
MFYYEYRNKVLVSNNKKDRLKEISETRASGFKDNVYILAALEPNVSRRSCCVSHPSLIFPDKEGIEMLVPGIRPSGLPDWLVSAIERRKVTSVNTEYPGWRDVLENSFPEKWKVNIAGLGDVGGMLLTGLRLLGGQHISGIGIHSRSLNNMKRWEHETGQILGPDVNTVYPPVYMLKEDDIFDCDLFVFCISAGVPPVEQTPQDVRMAQFEGNSPIIAKYAKKARQAGFKGIFAVLSDPVDLLCKTAFLESNTDKKGSLDFGGLAPEQIRGFGLGVMYARAAYYAAQSAESTHFIKEGRAFGPHGEGLVIADSIKNYNEELSVYLTKKALEANIYVRAQGYKPYVAPALSSGSLSLTALIKGRWHYSSVFLGGVYMGCRNRLLPSGTEIETEHLPAPLFSRLKKTYERLGEML